MKKINKKGEKGRWEETEGRERGVGDFYFFYYYFFSLFLS